MQLQQSHKSCRHEASLPCADFGDQPCFSKHKMIKKTMKISTDFVVVLRNLKANVGMVLGGFT
jgi:hypothetical protein